ncbi:MAG: phenylalanine--tRNA ligase subunit beta [Anaerovoracaceae bacterium]|nr:phenylalanine--tRNA ligase subunit beta [Anaerovoracaceae bacterium]
MLVSLEWLNDYTKMDRSTKEFADAMTLSGTNLEVINYDDRVIEKVVVGKVLSVERHPNADRLVIAKVDVGSGSPVNVITGAPNIVPGESEGYLVPVALDGAVVPGPMHGQPATGKPVKITGSEMRGVLSEAVMLSCSELGYDDKVAPFASHEGIWILPENEGLEPGDDLVEALKLRQDVVDFEITPNRPDCLCMVGIARESAATFGEEMHYPDTEVRNPGPDKSSDYVSVEIDDPNLCRRYYARVIKDIKIEQSPWWIQKRLMQAGMRPINNIVDLTNFVMLEYGQPLHAFDYRSIRGGKIIVKTAENGDTFTTLDGVERELNDQVLMINDAEGPIGLAGIMGGLDSEVKDDTQTVVLEAAAFDGPNIRASEKFLKHRTEGGLRFEKHLNTQQCKDASDRFCRLVELIGAGTVCEGAVDIYPTPDEPVETKVRVSRVNHVLGTDIPREEMEKYLRSLEIEVGGEGDIMICSAPTFRGDLSIEEDYIEEVARMYGYDRIPLTVPKMSETARTPEKRQMRDIAGNTLASLGFDETETYSFIDPAVMDKIMAPGDSWERDFVKILNPLGEETSVMRTMLIPGMMQSLATNYSRSNSNVRLFEIGRTFLPTPGEETKLPDEQYSLCIGMYGENENFYTLKGAVEQLLDEFGIDDLEFTAESGYETFHPGRCARISIAGEKPDEAHSEQIKEMSEKLQDRKPEDVSQDDVVMMQDMIRMMAGEMKKQPCEIGIMGEVHPDVCANYGIKERVYVCEIMFELVMQAADMVIEYEPLPVYPATSRDIALVVSEDVEVGKISRMLRQEGGELLESVELFDIYRGDQIDSGKKSVAFTLRYRDKNKTLTDDEANAVHNRVVEKVCGAFDAELRDE